MTGTQILYPVLLALGILICIAIALTLSAEGASALYMRDRIRLLLRTRVTSQIRTPSTGAAHLLTPTEDTDEIVVR